jgi:hypothetical protein
MFRDKTGGRTTQAHHVETTIKEGGTLTLENLPFHAGEVVEVIILARPKAVSRTNCYSLRGEPIRYVAPTEPVAHAEWEVER